MKNLFPKILIFILLISCSTPPVTVEFQITETVTTQPTATVIPSQTEIPLPTPTSTPLTVVTHTPHPLALNEFNAGTEMKLLNTFGTGTPHDIKFSPDGSLLAIATGRGVYFYDGETFEEVSFLNLNDSVSAIAFNPNGETIALAVEGKTSVWNIKSGQKLMDLPDEMIYVYKLVYGRQGHIAAIGGDCRGCGTPSEAIILWGLKSGQTIYKEDGIWYPTKAIEFNNNGDALFYGGYKGLTKLNINTLEKKTYADPMFSGIYSLNTPYDFILDEENEKIYIFSPEEDSQILNLIDNTIQVFNDCQFSFSFHFFAEQSKNIGICTTNESMVFFDYSSNKKIDELKIYTGIGSLFALSPNEEYFVSSNLAEFSVIKLSSEKVINKIPINNFEESQAGIVKINGQEYYVVALRSYPNKIEILDVQSDKTISSLQLEDTRIDDFTFAPDGKTVATLHESTLTLWDIKMQEVLFTINFSEPYASYLSFSPDGKKLILADQEKSKVLEFNLQNGERNEFQSNSYINNSPLATDNFQFTNNGNLISLDYEGDDIYNLTPFFTGIDDRKITLPYKIQSDFDLIETFTISPDNNYLVTGTPKGIFVWGMPEANLLFTLNTHDWRNGDGWIGAINHLLFAPNSNLLASVGFDGTTRLWNAKAGTELRILNVCCSASFTPDGRYFVTAGDGVIRVWGIPEK